MISNATRDRLRVWRRQLSTLPAHASRDSASVDNKPFSAPSIALESGSAMETQAGIHWECSVPITNVWPDAASLLATWTSPNKAPATAHNVPRDKARAFEQLAKLRIAFPTQVAFLDLETCGFAGSPIFLAGLIHYSASQGNVALAQLWARDFGEEASLLCALHRYLRDTEILVTFNGKSFDWPQVVDRSIRLLPRNAQPTQPNEHVDILHHARRAFRGRVSDCRLQTLERELCKRMRSDDLPSHEIPDAYRHYVSTRETSQVDRILAHNALDLVTLLQLSVNLMEQHGSGENMPKNGIR